MLALSLLVCLGLWRMLGRSRQRGRVLAERARRAHREARQREEWVAMVSHDLRTLLQGLLGCTELLARSTLTPQQRHWVEEQARTGRALNTLLGDLLDHARLQEGRLVLAPVDLDLPALLRDAVGPVRPLAEKKGLWLQTVEAPDLPRWVRGDPVRLRQVLDNLLANAVSFTEEGMVTLRASHRLQSGGLELILEVEDTGPGIEPEQLGRVFDRFVQGRGRTARQHGGTGLGLSICQMLVGLMGGTIAVESAPGRGSLFRVCLPLDLPAGARPLAVVPRTDEAHPSQAPVLARALSS
ncbi:HAMP domain-containing histidine kinase [Roseomonas sp. NAR14]|uniref:histidine kinase n=1 Tax=Roseomonas acroporae TaxID=2937791 RepID=A0A9X1Y8G7_9PROT|nr:HAMP domain-containing sensor histidine kinase [Roseomonas acroporae]MCK8785448.1 HAMP domain-containing histidine kinase [Roseomonas acroporae]